MPAHHSASGPRPRPEATSTGIVLGARLVLGEHESVDVPVRFDYRSDDPLAVALEFLGPAAEAGTWWFSRDLLWEGLQKPTGLGDVRIWPPCPCHGRTSLRVMLQGGDGGAVLVGLPARQVRRWLRRESFALVPRGSERSLLDWDGALDALTTG
ncbi:SsgA family sporulation/cell division regulator [Kitasatospora sp. NPDC047058]|uniref:SsgA family sporulation/cell division regulator n=1 Tax=Kitasatospora sp. NPDC047058 TaxID=3155620 RepID=UPI0033F1D8C9